MRFSGFLKYHAEMGLRQVEYINFLAYFMLFQSEVCQKFEKALNMPNNLAKNEEKPLFNKDFNLIPGTQIGI